MLQFLMTMVAGHKAKMDERGASAVEYGLLIAGIAAVIVVAVYALGNTITGLFTSTGASVGSGKASG